MDNSTVITELKTCVKKLKSDIAILTDRLESTTSDTPTLIQQQNVLNSLITEMIAEKNSLELVINAREKAKAGAIQALDPAVVAQFKTQMEKLNVVIQADQNFDKIVAAAKGINSAAAEMKTTTKA